MMIMGAFIPGLRRKYPAHEYVAALLLVFGLILFTMADAQTSPNFSLIGVLMISGALVMDSFLGNLQEAIFTVNPDTTQVIKHHLQLAYEYKNNLSQKCIFFLLLLISNISLTDGDAVLLYSSWFAFFTCTDDSNRRAY